MKALAIFIALISCLSFANNNCHNYFAELTFAMYENTIELPHTTTKPKYQLSTLQQLNILEVTLRHFDLLAERDFINLFGFSRFEVENAHADVVIEHQKKSAMATLPMQFSFREPKSFTDEQVQEAYDALIREAQNTNEPQAAKNTQSFKFWRDLLQSSISQRYSIYN